MTKHPFCQFDIQKNKKAARVRQQLTHPCIYNIHNQQLIAPQQFIT